MKLLIVTNEKYNPVPRKPFSVIMEDMFSERVVKHLQNDYAEICNGCGNDCDHCRDKFPALFPVDFKEDIAGVILLPAELPYYVDDPGDYLPDTLPPHDVMLAMHVHEDLLLSLPQRAKDAGAKALIVPSEDPAWLSQWIRGGSGRYATSSGWNLRSRNRSARFCQARTSRFCPSSRGISASASRR